MLVTRTFSPRLLVKATFNNTKTVELLRFKHYNFIDFVAIITTLSNTA